MYYVAAKLGALMLPAQSWATGGYLRFNFYTKARPISRDKALGEIMKAMQSSVIAFGAMILLITFKIVPAQAALPTIESFTCRAQDAVNPGTAWRVTFKFPFYQLSQYLSACTLAVTTPNESTGIFLFVISAINLTCTGKFIHLWAS